MPSAARTACAVLAAAVATSLTVVEAHPKIFWGKYDVPQCKTFFNLLLFWEEGWEQSQLLDDLK